MKNIFKVHIEDENELKEFALWAFGNEYEELQGINFLERWNFLHGDKLTLIPSEAVSIDAPKMVDLWKSSK